jgi:hypothetical protein
VQEGIVSGRIVNQSAESSLAFKDFFDRPLDPYLGAGQLLNRLRAGWNRAVDVQSRVRLYRSMASESN